MSGSPKEKLQQRAAGEQTDEHTDEQTAGGEQREVYLRDGRKLVISEERSEQLVEIRGASGMLELRIKLTEQGPVLQMDSVRLSLKASEAVEIEAPRVAINGTEQLALRGGEVALESEADVAVDAEGEIKVVGKMIYLN
jgi:hypothetical protein